MREAGIEVWTTMNVQHLESLSEAVARITGVRVAETVPDHVLAEADAVELIDIPPAELIERMRQGKVYRPDQVARALRGFFREGNPAALREMALRRTADRVDADVTGYMRANAIAGPWPAGDRVMALVGCDPAAEAVVRAARRIADALKAPLIALHVEQPSAPATGDPASAMQLAESLGAVAETVVATDLPTAILREARAQRHTSGDWPRPANAVAAADRDDPVSDIAAPRERLHASPRARPGSATTRPAGRAAKPTVLAWLGGDASPRGGRNPGRACP